jgi:hypothetical protein
VTEKRMGQAIARWICVHAGNLAVRLAPRAGIDLVLRVGSRRKLTQGGVIQRRTAEYSVMDLVCQNCYEVEWIYGGSGVEALAKTCGCCGAKRWRVKPHQWEQDHQQSRKA